MARRKRGTAGPVENKIVYSPTKQQLKKLQNEIKNYNRRLQTAIKKTSPELREYLPPKLSYIEEAGKINASLVTKYDDTINNLLLQNAELYAQGEVTKEEALEQFKKDVANAYQSITVE